MNASYIVEYNVNAHTHNGFTSWHMVADAHERTIRRLVGELNTLCGVGSQPSGGCHHAELYLGNSRVLVEFEAEPASGDGWNEPRHEATVAPLRVLINGVWNDCNRVVPEVVIERWTETILAGHPKDE